MKPIYNKKIRFHYKILEEIERIEGKRLNIDFAYPIEFQHELIRNGIDATYFVWSYEDSTFGKPLNLLERYFQALTELFDR